MGEIKMTIETAKNLVESGIISFQMADVLFQGASGAPTSIEDAAKAPQACQMVSLAGAIYNIKVVGKEFIFTSTETLEGN